MKAIIRFKSLITALICFLMTFLSLTVARAQWQESGSNIYYDADGSSVGPWVTISGGGGVFQNTALRLFDEGSADGNKLDVEFSHENSSGNPVIGARLRSVNQGNYTANGAKFFVETTSDNSGTYNSNQFVLSNDGNIGIGTKSPSEKLTVNGSTKTEEVIVTEDVGADFVFEDSYQLPNLPEVEQYINVHKHLPEIPSAEEMKKNGVKVGDLQMKLLQKFEELTLYVIELKKENSKLKEEVRELRSIVNKNSSNQAKD